MKQTKSVLLAPALLGLMLAACQQSASESDIAIDNGVDTAQAADDSVETPAPAAPSAAPAANETANAATPAPSAALIPAHYHGRWGMVAADCTSTRGDAKGLITIGDKTIRFYEATATLVEQRPATATGFAGAYHFSGEGREWDKVVTLKRSGDTLTRADDEGNFSYKRC